MLLTITTTYRPATDLGFLLHKHPSRCQTFPLSFGQAHVFYPEANEARCTAALLLDVDAVGLARGRHGPREEPLAAYVSDRPYVASSFLSVAIAEVFGTALAGRLQSRPELAATPLPLVARLAALPCRGGAELVRRLFEPLGYTVELRGYPLDERFPEWGESPYYTVTLAGTRRLAELLGHLYVLVPVLDREKHYYVGDDEIDKLLRHGSNWLAGHPERELIVQRYLRNNRRLTEAALARLLEDQDEEEAESGEPDAEEERVERPLALAVQRQNSVVAALKAAGARRVLDLGCGEGRLLQALLDEPEFAEITGVDVSVQALERAKGRLHYDHLPERRQQRIRLLHGSLVYRDARLAGYDAAAVMEVVEHLDPSRLDAFERALFEHARPGTVVLTTPNAEYNRLFPDLQPGGLRHRDHRFEWTRAEFRAWAEGVAERNGYRVRFLPVGPEDAEAGPPTQMGVFSR